MNHLSISAIARQYGIPPRRISDLFYARKLDDRICPIVDGRRAIPIEYLPTVETVLREGTCPNVRNGGLRNWPTMPTCG